VELSQNKEAILRIGIGLWVLALFSIAPLPGVKSTDTLSFEDGDYTFNLVKENSLDVEYADFRSIATLSLLEDEVTIATGSRGLFDFMSTCSHEVKHIEFIGDDLTEEEEHDRMSQIGGWIMPWDWESECVYLLDDRLFL